MLWQIAVEPRWHVSRGRSVVSAPVPSVGYAGIKAIRVGWSS